MQIMEGNQVKVLDLKQETHKLRNDACSQMCEMGDCYTAVENFAKAKNCYRQAAVLAPGRVEPFVGLGVVELHTKNYDRAQNAFDTAKQIAPQCEKAYSGLAMVFYEQQKYPQAFEMYLKCLELDADNLIAMLGLFQTSCQMGTFAKIIHYLETYLEKNPHDHSVLFCLATLYARERKDIQAKQLLLTILAADPEKPQARELLETVQARLYNQQIQEVA